MPCSIVAIIWTKHRNSLIALGYIAGVNEVLDGMHIICTGGRFSSDQIRDEVVKYLGEHPRQRDMDADDLTSIALSSAFPCK